MEERSVCAYTDSLFCLGMYEWTDCPTMAAKLRPCDKPLPSTRSGLDESHSPLCKKNEPLLLECFTFASDEQLASLTEGTVLLNTTKSAKWALKVFED